MAVTTSETDAAVEKTASRQRHGALRWAGQVLSWFVMLTIGAALLVAFVVPRLAGGTTYVVETGSMRPGLPPGTLVVVRPAEPTDISAGDVITYQIRSGDPTVVTHRVITVGYDGAGEVRWRTQGDANNAADVNWVMPEQLKGRLWYNVPFIGYGTSVVTQQQRGLMVGLIALGLGGYALVQFRGAAQDRKRKKLTTDASS
jgi:signal peptidase I